MKVILAACRLLVGVLFIFSGLIKLNDPTGFSIKLDEYFSIFHLTFLGAFTVYIAIILCSLEVVAGSALLTGIRPKAITVLLLVLVIFFSLLTFYSAYFHKVDECGCFGDAIHLTPWQSFYKNVVLLCMVLVLYYHNSQINTFVKPVAAWTYLIIVSAASFSIGIYTWHNLPFIDFLPYRTGAYLPSLTKVPAGAEPDRYEVNYRLRNKKSGQVKSLTDAQYISTHFYEDKDWEIISSSEPKLIEKGYQAPLSDFHITDAAGSDVTEQLLNTEGYLVIYDEFNLESVSPAVQKRLNELAILSEGYAVRTIGLTWVSTSVLDDFCARLDNRYEIFYCDETPLKTMIRANPGVLLLHSGTVVGKWSMNNLPSIGYFKALYELN